MDISFQFHTNILQSIALPTELPGENHTLDEDRTHDLGFIRPTL